MMGGLWRKTKGVLSPPQRRAEMWVSGFAFVGKPKPSKHEFKLVARAATEHMKPFLDKYLP
jgi:hypothetical protein